LVTGAKLVATQIIASIGEFGLHLAVTQPERTCCARWRGHSWRRTRLSAVKLNHL